MKQALMITASVLGLAFALAFYHHFTTDHTIQEQRLAWHVQPDRYLSFYWQDGLSGDTTKATLNSLTGQPSWQFWALPGLQTTQVQPTLQAVNAIKPPLRLPGQADPSMYAMGNK